MSPPSITREDQWCIWAKAAQKGDKRAYNRLLTDIIPFIRSVIAPSLAREDMIDDVVQNTLLSVHKALATYSPQRPFKPWLLAIIHFRKADRLRRHYRQVNKSAVALDDVAEAALSVTQSPYAGEYKDIEAALSALSDKQRRVFVMMKIEGYSAKEVAEKVNMSVSAVKVSVHRTLQKLKDGRLDG